MMSARSSLLLILGISFILICPFREVAAKEHLPEVTLTQQELQDLVVGKTAEVIFGNSRKGLVYFDPGGNFMRIKRDRMKLGEWKISKKGRLCTRFGEAKWDCRILVSDGDVYQQYVVKKSGKHEREMTYQKFHKGQQFSSLQTSPILPDGTLTRKKLKELFSGKTVESKTVNKGRVSMTYYNPSGAVEQMRNGTVRTGTWRVTKKDRICLKMESSREKCRIVVREGGQYNKYIIKKNGQHQRSVTYLNFADGRKF